MAHLDRACSRFDTYMSKEARTWYRRQHGEFDQPYIAYFSMEYGLTECLRNYSGGLGVLSGDHLKSASDLGLPLVGIGLLYEEGYFHQYLNADGYQHGINHTHAYRHSHLAGGGRHDYGNGGGNGHP